MKTLKIKTDFLTVFLLALVFLSCNRNKVDYGIELQENLSGLKKASTDDLVRLSPLKWNASNEPMFYSFNGGKLTRSEFQQLLKTKKYEQVFFLDKSEVVKAVVLEPLNKKSINLNEKGLSENFNLNKKIPKFEITDIEGNVISSEEMKGKVIVLNFWFIKCPPCRKEIPELNKLVESFNGKGVKFISITTDSKKEILNFFEKNRFNYTHVASKSFIRKHRISEFPTNIVVDRNSNISFLEVGGRKDILEILESEINKALL